MRILEAGGQRQAPQIGEQFKILDPARVPERPFSPIGCVCSDRLGARPRLGIVVIVLLEFRDATFKTEEDIVRAPPASGHRADPDDVLEREVREARRRRNWRCWR